MADDRKHNPSFSLNNREMDFISSMVSGGRFGNRTEVVRAGLRLLEDYESNMALQRLQSKIDLAEDSIRKGDGIRYSNGDALAQDIIRQGEQPSNG